MHRPISIVDSSHFSPKLMVDEIRREADMTRGEYLENAEQCMQLARRAKEPQRSKLVHLANAWLDLAGEDVPLVPSAQDEGDDDYAVKPKAAKR